MQDVWPNTSEIIQTKHKDLQKSLDSLDIKIKVEASAEYMLDDLFFTRIKEKDINVYF